MTHTAGQQEPGPGCDCDVTETGRGKDTVPCLFPPRLSIPSTLIAKCLASGNYNETFIYLDQSRLPSPGQSQCSAPAQGRDHWH